MNGASGPSVQEIVGRWSSSDYIDEVDCVANPQLTLAELTVVFQRDDLLEHPGIAVILANAAWALNQGLWAARSNVTDIERCLAAVSGVFQTVAAEPTRCPDGLLHMFWDIACGRSECGDEEIEVAPVCGRLLTTLSYILSLDSKECQLSALHGLNHMPSRAASQIIHQHYESLFDNEVRGYAGTSLAGRAL